MNNPSGNIQRVVYIGTPEIAIAPLVGLLESGYEVPLVITGEDKRRGRGSRVTPCPVKQEAERLGLKVSSDIDDVKSVHADLGILVAFGKLVPSEVLEYLKIVNIHFSLLPRWRGAAPLERAILAGDDSTGVCIMELEKTLDTGGIYRSIEIPIDPLETLKELQKKCVTEGTALLLQSLKGGLGDAVAQEGEVSYAHKLSTDELKIEWKRPSEAIHRLIRIGRAWTTVGGSRLRVLSAMIGDQMNLRAGERDGIFVGSGDGSIELLIVQPEGKKKMPATEWINGLKDKAHGPLGHE